MLTAFVRVAIPHFPKGNTTVAMHNSGESRDASRERFQLSSVADHKNLWAFKELGLKVANHDAAGWAAAVGPGVDVALCESAGGGEGAAEATGTSLSLATFSAQMKLIIRTIIRTILVILLQLLLLQLLLLLLLLLLPPLMTGWIRGSPHGTTTVTSNWLRDMWRRAIYSPCLARGA